MKSVQFFRMAIITIAISIVIGHQIIEHSHFPINYNSEQGTSKKNIADLLKDLFAYNLGEGHLENFRTEYLFEFDDNANKTELKNLVACIINPGVKVIHITSKTKFDKKLSQLLKECYRKPDQTRGSPLS